MPRSEPGLPDPFLTPYTSAQIDFARAAWPLRAAEELRSALVYRALAHAADQAGLDARWIAPFHAVAGDEMAHVRLCRAVGGRLDAAVPHYDRAPVRARAAGFRDPLATVSGFLLVEVAVGESISAALFRAGRRFTVEPLAGAALETILTDEVRHAHLGWEALGALWPTLSEPRRLWMQQEAARGLAGLEQTIAVPALRWLERGASFDPALAELGVLAPETRVEAFYAAVEQDVLARLTAVGLDGRQAWAARYRMRA